MLNNIVQERDGVLRVSSLVVANRTENEHRAVLQLVTTYSDDLAQFGQVAFEMRPGYNNAPVRVAHLNEAQATLLIAFMRNSEIVRAFKVELVRQFQAMKQALVPSLPGARQLALMVIEAEDAREAAEQRVAELEPSANAWDDLASGEGSYPVADVAKILNQAGIETGRDRLFQFMQDIGWLFRQSGRLQARQTAVDAGRLVHKPQSHRHPETGETVLDSPQVRVTVKGIEQLRALMLPPVSELVLAS